MNFPIKDFYELTPLEFFAYREGFVQLRDADSKERITLTRKIMWASLAPYSKNLKENQIMEFDWEKTTFKELSELELQQKQIEIQESIDFWKRIDSKKATC